MILVSPLHKGSSTSCLFLLFLVFFPSGCLLIHLSNYIMGFLFVFIKLIFQNLLPCHFIKDMLLLVLPYIPLQLGKLCLRIQDFDGSSEEYHRPSPLLVPVPAHCIVESLKDQLQVVECSRLLKKLRAPRQDNVQCAVCLNCIGESQEVRELGNCCHVFHKECIDIWMDQGQGTCPLCRSKLSPANQGKELKCGGDPWRRERMIYLFGEDYVMGNATF